MIYEMNESIRKNRLEPMTKRIDQKQKYENKYKKLTERHNQQLQKFPSITRNFLTFMKAAMGKLNTLVRFVFQRGNKCNIKSIGTSAEDDTVRCSLLSQCYTTSQTINYFFCEPVTLFTHISQLPPFMNMKDIFMNIEISIDSTMSSSIIMFPGHVFNIIIIPNHIFWIQSYIYKYTIQFKEITYKDLVNIIESYQQLFVFSKNPYFVESDNEEWKRLTNVELIDYYGRSLIGTIKPRNYQQKFCVHRVNDLNRYLTEKYYNLLLLGKKKIVKNYGHPHLQKHITTSFGINQTSTSIYTLIEKSIEQVHKYLI